jgi:acetolactate synthase-1/2/3 large subunit
VPTILSRALYEMEQHTEIKRIVTHGEKAAVYMADGYARAAGSPGVCGAQNVGGANLAAGLRDPFLACSPVVAFTGGPFGWSVGRNYYQEVDNLPFFAPVTKFSGHVPDASRLPDLLEHAFWAATVSKPGPTHLELPGHAGEILEAQEVDVEAVSSIRKNFSLPPVRTGLPQQEVQEAVHLLRTAWRPVIVAGGGARASGAKGELIALAERLNIPIATSLNAKDIVPSGHPLSVGVPGLYSRASANQVLLEADLVFFVGSQTSSQVTLRWQVPPQTTRTIQLDIDPAELGRHYSGSLRLCADAKVGLQQLASALADAELSRTAPWLRRVNELGQRWRNDVERFVGSDQVPMRPERLCAELSRHLPDDALVVSDTGHAGMWTGGYLDLKSPRQSYLRAAGSLGWGLPAALGAQVAMPDRPVVLFTGDGGLWYHLSELETAARWNIPAVIVVNNNRSLNQEIWPYLDAYGGTLHGRHHELWHFRDIDLAKVAESMGVGGLTVERPSDFAGALAQAVEARGPMLINVVSDIDALAPPGSPVPASM